MTLADRVVILKDGEIQQIGTPMEVYKKPANKFVASFIGSPEMNFMEYPDFSLGIRPEDIYIRGSEPKMIRPQELEGTVILVEKLGAESLLRVKSGKHDLTVKINGISTARTGDELALVFDKKDMHRF
jgi:multiple sugar transport system ATP-binding protein